MNLKGDLKLSRGKGCEKCRNTGYLGRVAVFEIMPYSEKLRQMALNSEQASAFRAEARAEGMSTLHENALRLMLDGTTTFQEVFRVTPPD